MNLGECRILDNESVTFALTNYSINNHVTGNELCGKSHVIWHKTGYNVCMYTTYLNK